MSETDKRQAARQAWVSVLKDAWHTLGHDAREHCVSLSNLSRWWPGTQPVETELLLRKEMDT